MPRMCLPLALLQCLLIVAPTVSSIPYAMKPEAIGIMAPCRQRRRAGSQVPQLYRGQQQQARLPLMYTFIVIQMDLGRPPPNLD